MKIEMTVRRLCLLTLTLGLVRASAADYYVSTQGNDSNSGSAAQPFRTITRAYSLASAGTTITVLPGVYTDYQSGWGLHLNKSGTASSPITLRSQVRGQAIIDGQNLSDRNVAIYLDGSYNIIDGLQIRGGPKGGITIWGNYNQIVNNDIHHNGNPASSSTLGQDGVYSGENTRNTIYRANYIHDNGRTGSNLDHALYLCGDNELVINNVLIRNASYGLHIAGYTTVSSMKAYNNVMAHNGKSGIILWMAVSGVDIKNNIIYQNGKYGIDSYDAHGSGVIIDRNLVFGNSLGNYALARDGSDFTYTLGTTISAAPLFVNSTSAGFDAHLGAGSPAINAAQNLSATFTTDCSGATRPASGAWDLGAYKYGNTVNTAPTISSIANQTITMGNSTAPLAFTVSDLETAAGSLTVSRSSSNPTLVPTSGIVFGGSGSSRTVTVTPAANQTGTATLTVTVSDGSLTRSTSFVLTVNSLPAPTVTLTAPVNGANYTAPATLNLGASVTANGNTISKVQFYQGSTVLGEDTTAPYGFTWSGVSAGSYNLSARAVYNTSSTVTSPTASVNVSTSLTSGLTLGVGSGTITAPFVIANGTISQPAYAGVTAGGRAAYTFAVSTAGDYLVSALVNAPDESANSFFVNMDAEPSDPTMIWDIPLTSGLAERTVAWRGNGTFAAAQFAPKVFNLSAGTHTLIVRGREANAQLATLTIRPATALPAPWQTLDIGNVGVAGGASIANGLHTVTGAGNISGSADGFRFVYQTLSGDGEIKARLNSVANTGTNGAVGVMIRETLTPGANYGFMGVTPDLKFRWQSRSSTSGSTSITTSGAGTPPNAWVRLVRTGTTLYGYKSADGVNWTLVNSRSITMAANIHIGLAVASGSTSTLNTSTFSSMSVVP